MGQARQRGTQAERRKQAIEKQDAEFAARKQERESKTGVENRSASKRRIGKLAILTAIGAMALKNIK